MPLEQASDQMWLQKQPHELVAAATHDRVQQLPGDQLDTRLGENLEHNAKPGLVEYLRQAQTPEQI
jgi:hypothetical protein